MHASYIITARCVVLRDPGVGCNKEGLLKLMLERDLGDEWFMITDISAGSHALLASSTYDLTTESGPRQSRDGSCRFNCRVLGAPTHGI
jgi:hypothetical protein